MSHSPIRDIIKDWCDTHQGLPITAAMGMALVWKEAKTHVNPQTVANWLNRYCDKMSAGVWTPKEKARKTQFTML